MEPLATPTRLPWPRAGLGRPGCPPTLPVAQPGFPRQQRAGPRSVRRLHLPLPPRSVVGPRPGWRGGWGPSLPLQAPCPGRTAQWLHGVLGPRLAAGMARPPPLGAGSEASEKTPRAARRARHAKPCAACRPSLRAGGHGGGAPVPEQAQGARTNPGPCTPRTPNAAVSPRALRPNDAPALSPDPAGRGRDGDPITPVTAPAAWSPVRQPSVCGRVCLSSCLSLRVRPSVCPSLLSPSPLPSGNH